MTEPLKLADMNALDHARRFAGRLIYATPEQLDAMILLCAVTHLLPCFNTVGRFLATSKFKGSGKTTIGQRVPSLLVWNPWFATNATEPAVRAQFRLGETTMFFDEISKLLGEAGTNGKHSMKLTIMLTGYEAGATAPYSNGQVPDDIPIFGVVFMTGLKKAAPDDLRSRCIIVNMREAPRRIAAELEDALDPDIRREGFDIGRGLHQWARSSTELVAKYYKNGLRGLHPHLVNRHKEVWGPLFAVAMAAGGTWPERCMRAFCELALDSGQRPHLVAVEQVLLDAADFANEAMTSEAVIFSRDLKLYIEQLDRECYEDLSERALAKLMTAALGSSQTIRGVFAYPLADGSLEEKEAPHKGWYMTERLIEAADLRAKRNLNPPEEAPPDEFDTMFE